MTSQWTHESVTYDPERISLVDSQGIHSVLDADRVNIHVGRGPDWWQEMVSQAKEIRAARGRSLIADLPGGDYLITGRYLESFYSWLDEQGIDHYYDRRYGVVVRNPHFPDTLNSALSRSGITATTVAAGRLTPRTPQTIRLEKDAESARKEGFAIPSHSLFPSNRTLMPHQVPVVLALAWRGKGLLADDVGSGKSSMFINGFFSLVQYRSDILGEDLRHLFPLVIVTKRKLNEPTMRECKAWFSGCRVHVVGASAKKTDPLEGAHVIVTSPLLLAKNMSSILSQDPQGVVFDESHMFKNPVTKSTKAAMTLAKHIRSTTDTPYVVCATATPMPNRPSELWSQISLTGMSGPIIDLARSKQNFPSRTKYSLKGNRTIPVSDQTVFEMRYCKGRPGPFGWEAKGSAHEAELSAALREQGLIRRKKSEFITPLPLLHQKFLRCTLSDEDQERYRIAEEQFRDHIVLSLREKGEKLNWSDHEIRNEIMNTLFKSTHSEAIMKMTAVRQLVGIAKVDSIVEWIHRFFAKDPAIVGRDSTRNKLIVFAHHREVQSAIINHPDLQQYGMASIVADTKNVNDVVDLFQDPRSGIRLLVCFSEAREGLTLTAAKDVLVAELPFVPSWLIQMAGRCWARISENYPPHEAYLHYAVADVDIDDYLEKMIRDKGWLHKAIIDGEIASDVLNDAESEED